MKYTKTINLDVNKPFYEVLHAKQNDNARYLLFNLLNNGVPFALTDKTVRAYAIKPDNTKVYNDLTIINAINGQAELQLTSQMLAVPGMISVELVIFEGADILSTIKFVIEVTGNLRNDAAIESTNEFSALVNALASIDNLEVNYAPRLTSVESSLSDITQQTINPIAYGITGQEITDVSSTIQTVLNLAISQKQKKIIFPKGIYKLANILNINTDDVEVDFQGSTIEWIGSIASTTEQSTYRSIGVINVKGSCNIGSAVEITALAKQAYDGNFILTVSDASGYSEGDFVKVDLNCGHIGEVNNGSLYPELNQMCQIMKIVGNAITINITNDFDYSIKNNGIWYNATTHYPVDITNPVDFGAKLYKVIPVKNVIIKNFEFIDSQAYTDGVTVANTCVPCISSLYAYNLKVQNISGEHIKYPLVINRWCQKGEFKNIKVKKADSISAGMGYGIQTIWSNDIDYINIEGDDVRHTADFSGVLNGRMYNVRDYNNLRNNSGIGIHGMCEYNIKLENCSANWISIGHGTDSFPCIMDRFKFINCDMSLQCSNKFFSTNFDFENCNLTGYTTSDTCIISLGNSVFKNCKLSNLANAYIPKTYWDMTRRGYLGTLKLLFDNCNIDFESARVTFAWQDSVKFINNNIKLPSSVLVFSGVNEVIIDNNSLAKLIRIYINGIEFSSINSSQIRNIDFVFTKNIITKTLVDIEALRRIGFSVVTNCKITSNVSDNLVNFEKNDVTQVYDSLALMWISHGSDIQVDGVLSDYTGSTIISKFNNNTMKSSNQQGLGYATATNAVYTLQQIARGNIIINPATFDTCDTTYNVKI